MTVKAGLDPRPEENRNHYEGLKSHMNDSYPHDQTSVAGTGCDPQK